MSRWRDEWVEGWDMCYSYDVIFVHNKWTNCTSNEAFINSCEE